MADRREEVSGGSPSKRPKLDHEAPITNVCSSDEKSASTLLNDPKATTSTMYERENFDSNLDPSSSTSDRGEGSGLGSASGAAFENHGDGRELSQKNEPVFPCETSEVDQPVTGKI